MARLLALPIVHHRAFDRVEYALHLDSDALLTAAVGEDLFERARGAAYKENGLICLFITRGVRNSEFGMYARTDRG